MSELNLLNGYSARAPKTEDAQAITNLIIACDIAEVGEPDFAIEDLLTDWGRAGFALARDARVVTTATGHLAGYVQVWEREPGAFFYAHGFVHPQYHRRGLGAALVRWMETRARESLSDGQFARLMHYIYHPNESARTLFERAGFRPVRYAWRMLIEMDEPPPAPQWPAGIGLRSFVPGADDRTVHAVITEAFSDLDDFHPMEFEGWAQLGLRRPDFDPSLLFVAVDDGEMAGVAVCFRWPNLGWVRTLAVRRPWRRRGLGLALLHHAFGEFYRRGERNIGLGVDSQNATGATRLYERAGMRMTWQHDQYEKVIGDSS
jgi:mycothiol synthase